MIIRIFRAWVRPGMHKEYETLIHEQAIPKIKAQPGLISVYVGTPMSTPLRSPDEYAIISIWKDLDSLKALTGESWRTPVTLPGEIRLVKETTVTHYETDGNV
jgi:heme-degrading monooxygenase HmoA